MADAKRKESNQSNNTMVDGLQRNAYLNSKGINPKKQFQLDLIFPNMLADRDDLRHIPNDYARSSLFTARNKRTPREALLQEKLFHYNQSIEMLFTGIELRAEDDELVWMQLLHYGKGTPFGEPFEFSIKDLVQDVGWSKNGRYYDKARECISRLKANEILAKNTKAYGKSGSVSLIQNYTAVNDRDGKATQYRVWIDPNLIVLFAGNTFTSHSWIAYRDLSPVARRLADHIASHQYPFALATERFQQMCGSNDSSITSWRQTVKKACLEIEVSGIAKRVFLENGAIHCVRK